MHARAIPATALAALLALTLTSCAASELDQAHAGCIADAVSQLPEGLDKLNTDGVETANFSELAQELSENPLGKNPEAATMYTTTGDIWYRTGDKDNKVGVLCITSFKDGKPTEPIEATLIRG